MLIIFILQRITQATINPVFSAATVIPRIRSQLLGGVRLIVLTVQAAMREISKGMSMNGMGPASIAFRS